MKKTSLILILISCFAVGVSINIAVIRYEKQKAKQQFIEKFKKVLPELTPTQVFTNYWIFASQNRLDEIKLLATEIPKSYWIRCSNDRSEHIFEDTVKQDGEFSGVILQLRHDIRMMRANHPRLSEAKILNEVVFEDEAIVDFEYLRDKNRAFFKKIDGSWKLFIINSLTLDFMAVDEYAHPRQYCKAYEISNKKTDPKIFLPEMKEKID